METRVSICAETSRRTQVCETEEESLTCKNMQEYGKDMDCERYKCTVCGRRMKLDYDEMR